MFRSSSIIILNILLVFALCGIGCNSNMKEARRANAKSETSGQTEQCARDKKENSDNLKKQTTSSITNSKYPVENILGIWTIDPDGPHADFEINRSHYFLVDQEGDAERLYTICGDSITVHFKDFTSRGRITKAENDTLVIDWDNQGPTVYTRWKE